MCLLITNEHLGSIKGAILIKYQSNLSKWFQRC